MTGRTVCVNRASTGLWGSRGATTGSTRRSPEGKPSGRPDYMSTFWCSLRNLPPPGYLPEPDKNPHQESNCGNRQCQPD
jgi:hypothetical protein